MLSKIFAFLQDSNSSPDYSMTFEAEEHFDQQVRIKNSNKIKINTQFKFNFFS